MSGRRAPAAILGLVAVTLLALAAFGYVLIDSQRSSREDIEGRIGDRADAGATLISSIFSSSAASGRARLTDRYGGPDPAPAALTRQAQEGGSRFLVVARPDGTVLASSDGTPDGVAAELRRRPAWFRAALEGQSLGSSSIRDSVAPGTLSFAQAFPGADGPRVLITGSDPQVLAEFFAGALERLPAVRGGRTFLLDRDGAVLASPGTRVRIGARLPRPRLLRAVARADRGDAGDDRFYAASAISGTPWRVVLTAPRDELFASVEGLRKWGPWMLFAAFALAAAAAIVLVRRTLRDGTRILEVNAQLESANGALRERADVVATMNAELEHKNGELARSNAELERFASIASHDLREPLRKVQMFSERVIHHEGENLSPRGRDYLERMDAAAARMQTLIGGLLEYARLTTHAADFEHVDLEQVAHEVVDDLAAVLREQGGEVVVGPLPSVPADPLKMRQLLQNLISNGLRFRREGVPPMVRLSGTVDGDEAVLEVQDNGIGFEARHAERIFELFERLHPRGVYAGTGMGLALCRRIVERHDGSITARSTPGAGSTFIIRLPMDPRSDDTTAAIAEAAGTDDHAAR
jgi:signal transduction histidine kinase